MASWVTMSGLGFVMETMKLWLGMFFPFFLLFWVIINVSVPLPGVSGTWGDGLLSGLCRFPRSRADGQLLHVRVRPTRVELRYVILPFCLSRSRNGA